MAEQEQNILNSFAAEVESADMTETRRQLREIQKKETGNRYERMLESDEEEKLLTSIDLSVRDVEMVKRDMANSTEYLKMAQNAKTFVNNDFDGLVPYFPRNLILIAAETGQGKSTACANLAYHATRQGQKILIITNEENRVDVYNRITCLIKGWSYQRLESFTSEQIATLEEYIEILSHRITIVDDNYQEGVIGQTTTIEGIEGIFKHLIKDKVKFDLILIDYYQNIDRSIRGAGQRDWEIQGRFSKFMDKFKNVYDAPVALFAQKKDQNDGKTSFKQSLEGRKSILNVVTCAVEIIADYDNRRTGFKFYKSRFTSAVGKEVYVGYDKGMYVPYTQEFKQYVLAMKDAQTHAQTLSGINPNGTI